MSMELVSVGLTLAGLATMVYGGYLNYNVREALQGGQLRKVWDYFGAMLVILALFYVAYLAQLTGYLFSFEMPSTASVIVAFLFLVIGVGTVGIMYRTQEIFS